MFDLDDTLIDTKLRQYVVIRDFFIQKRLFVPSFDRYLSDRSVNKMSNQKWISNISQEHKVYLPEYSIFHRNNIEALHYLKLDKKLIQYKYLDFLEQTNFNLIIISLRRNTMNALEQLKALELLHYFKEFFFLPHSKTINPKTQIIKDLKTKYEIKCMIGDSLTDYEAASNNGVHAIGVNTGMYSLPSYMEQSNNINDLLKSFANEKI